MVEPDTGARTNPPTTAPRPAAGRMPASWRGFIARTGQAWANRWARLRARPSGPYLLPALLVFVVTSLVVLAMYLNHPQVELCPDSIGYLAVARAIRAHGDFVNAMRLPGYPSLIALVFALSGGEHLALVSAVQGALYVLAAVEVFVLTALLTRRVWLATTIGLLMGTNLYLVKYAQPIMSDGPALWLVVTLALAVVICVRWPRPRHVWLVGACLFALFMTRPEWIYAPVPVFAYLLVVAARQGTLRRLWPHALGATLALYLLLGSYVYQNATRNDYAGVTWVQNVNLLGKVMELGMQDEAPAQYAPVARMVDAYLAHGGLAQGPWGLVNATPALNAHHDALAGAFGLAVIEHHPLEFVAREIPLLVTSGSFAYTADEPTTILTVRPAAPLGAPLQALAALSAVIYWSYEAFLAVVALWLGRALWRRVRRADPPRALRALCDPWALGAVLLLGIYGLGITILAAYGDYARIRSSFQPLLLIAVWTTVLSLAAFSYRWRQPATPTMPTTQRSPSAIV